MSREYFVKMSGDLRVRHDPMTAIAVARHWKFNQVSIGSLPIAGMAGMRFKP